MEVFKVRNSEGLYWEEHSRYKFTKHGKSWSGTGICNFLKACEIVKFELKEVETIKI